MLYNDLIKGAVKIKENIPKGQVNADVIPAEAEMACSCC